MKNKSTSRSPELLAALSKVGLPPTAPRLGSYYLGETMSSNSAAIVSLAVDLKLGRAVLIKRLRPEAARDRALRERFEHEAMALGYLEVYGVVRLYHTELDGPEPYFVTEWVEGRTLRDFSRAVGPLAPHAVMIILCELARTLVLVHQAGIVHGGLDVSRVIIHSERVGRLVISGFDRAAILDDPRDETPLSPQGTWTGAFGSAAPEQLLGMPVSVKADQFALGVMAYELLTGHRPFEGRTVEAHLELIHEQRYRRPRQVDSRVPEPLAEVIERSLRFDPGERWPDMGAIAKALEQGLRHDLFEDPTVEARFLFDKSTQYLARLDERVATMLTQKTMALANEGHTAEALVEGRRLVLWRPRHAPSRELLGKLKAVAAREGLATPEPRSETQAAEETVEAEKPAPESESTSRAPWARGGAAMEPAMVLSVARAR